MIIAFLIIFINRRNQLNPSCSPFGQTESIIMSFACRSLSDVLLLRVITLCINRPFKSSKTYAEVISFLYSSHQHQQVFGQCACENRAATTTESYLKIDMAGGE